MKTKALIASALTLAYAGAMAQAWGTPEKQIELTVGGHFYGGDLKKAPANFGAGFLAGIDYLWYPLGDNVRSLIGVRGWFGSKNSINAQAFGAHWGVKMNFSVDQAGPQSGAGQFYLKGGIGYYNNSVTGAGNKWGVGGFGGLGYEFGEQFMVEIGYQFAPSTGGVDNNGWYAALGIRV